MREGLIDSDRVAATVRLTQTTSPSLPILAGLDACRRQMVLEGEGLLERAIGLAFAARRRLGALPGLRVLGAAQLDDALTDPTRLVIDVQGLGMSGFAVERVLRERFGIAPAIGERAGVVCVITIGDTPQSVDRLVGAFTALCAERGEAAAIGPAPRCWGFRTLLTPGPQRVSPREAFFAPSRSRPVHEAIGQVAAELVILYPPGIPAVVPGESIAAETVTYLQDGGRYGMHLRGVVDPTLATLRIVT